ncbi:hypothetical protein, variant [Spizellomyces punctatus DAOM BR117]|uniref:3'-5' exonuclease n=1 Tax=Spizellomyces punctatus (strain DAOM BR117) TaxID=645134 RepID=A0A0L0HL03_SPIPD|nr:hypothetical protein, variant [Spizellomyces punctatus DAOM BR117]KND02106.1 hypothetical protein, variant [Spizellomyces punctatus DAOM BR117]|eukprot:XP_016610145.1 hypothetical protein, variant [Spizellomyces punctatus DAOM BR117]
MWPCRSFTVQETLLPRALRAAAVRQLGVPCTFGDRLHLGVREPLFARSISHSTAHSLLFVRQQRATYTTFPSPAAINITPIPPISQVDQEKVSNHTPESVSAGGTRDEHAGISDGPVDSNEASRATSPPVPGEPMKSGIVLPTRAQPVKYETDWDDGVLDLITKSVGGENANADIADEISPATACGTIDKQASDVGQGDTSVRPATACGEDEKQASDVGQGDTSVSPATACGKDEKQASDIGQGDTSVSPTTACGKDDKQDVGQDDTSVGPAATADLESSCDITHLGPTITVQEVDLASGDLLTSSEALLGRKSSEPVDVNVLDISEENRTAEASADKFSGATPPQDPLSVATAAQYTGAETAKDIPTRDGPSEPDSDLNMNRLSRMEISMASLVAEQEQIASTLNGLATNMTGLATDMEATKDQLHAFRHSAIHRMDSSDGGWSKNMKQLEDRIVQIERKEQYLWNKLLQLKGETDASLKQLRAQVDKIPDLLERRLSEAQEKSTTPAVSDRRSIGFNPTKAIRNKVKSIRNHTITTVQRVVGVADSITAKVSDAWSSARRKTARVFISLGNKVSPLTPEISSVTEVGERKLDADLLVPIIVRRLTTAGIRPYTTEPYAIYLIDSISEAETFMSIVMDESGTSPHHRIRVVGFDTETAFRNDEHNNFGPTSMVQIAFAEGLVGIFQIYRMCAAETSGTLKIDKSRFPKLLKAFISSTITIKTGVGIWGDLKNLQRHYDVEIPIEAVVSLDSLGRTIGVQRWSLAALSSQYCDMELQKGTSPPKRWDAPRNLISRNAVLYAANDALAGLRIYKSMVRPPKERTLVSDDTSVERVQSPVIQSGGTATTAASFDEIADNIFPKMRKALFGQRQVVPRLQAQRWMMAAVPAWKELSDFEKRENAHRCVDIFIKDRRLLQGRRGLALASQHPTSRLTAKNLPSSQYVLIDTSSNDVGDDKLIFEEISTSNTSSPSNVGRDTSDSAVKTVPSKPADQRSGVVDTPVQAASGKPTEKSKSTTVDKSPPAKIAKEEHGDAVDTPLQTASASAKPAEKSKSVAVVDKTPPATLVRDESSGTVDSSVQMSAANAKAAEGEDVLGNAAAKVQSLQDIADQIAAALDDAGDAPFFTIYRQFFDTPIAISTISASIQNGMNWSSIPKTVDRSLISDALIQRLRQQGRLVDATVPDRVQLVMKAEDIPKEVLTQIEMTADPFVVLWKVFNTRGTQIGRLQKHLVMPQRGLWPDCKNHSQRQLFAMVSAWQLYVNQRLLRVDNNTFRLDPNDAAIPRLAASKQSKKDSSKPEKTKKDSSKSNAAKEEISAADGTKEPPNVSKSNESKNTGAAPKVKESNVPTHPSSVAVISASTSSEPSTTCTKESHQSALDAHAREDGTTVASSNVEDGIAQNGMTASTANTIDSGLPIKESSEAEIKHEVVPIDTVLMTMAEAQDPGGEEPDPIVRSEGDAPTGSVATINVEKHEKNAATGTVATINLETHEQIEATGTVPMINLETHEQIEATGAVPMINLEKHEQIEATGTVPTINLEKHEQIEATGTVPTINLEKHEQIDLSIFEDKSDTLEPTATVQALETNNMTELASDDNIAPEESGSALKIPTSASEVREVSVETPNVVEARHTAPHEAHALVQTKDVLQTEGQAALGEIEESKLPVKSDTAHMVTELRQIHDAIPPQTTSSVQTSKNTATIGVLGDIERSRKPDMKHKDTTAPRAASTVDRQLEKWMAALQTRKER